MNTNHTNEESGPNALLRAERDGSKDRSGPFAIRYLEGRCRDLDPDYAGSPLEADVLKARKLFDELTAALRGLADGVERELVSGPGARLTALVKNARAAIAKVRR